MREMLRNPALKNQFKYTPPSVGGFDLEDEEGKSGIFNYMCTVAANGEWDSDNQVFYFLVTIYIFDADNMSEGQRLESLPQKRKHRKTERSPG